MLNFRHLFLLVILLFAFSDITLGRDTRTEIRIPDITGYFTLKCDFHTHTVFSDGNVWPTLRVEEAWCEGLDAISITDHIEYQPHKADVPTQHNRPYEIALPRAEELGIILIRGTEITRQMPPGHINAIFLQDINPLDTENWRDAVKAANAQGAFVFWNHPGWRQPDEIPIWYDEHTELVQQRQIQGIEVVNWDSHYSKVQPWAQEKNLTLMGNSDVHGSTNMAFDFAKGEHRPMTLVFAKEKTAAAIKDALFDRCTSVYFENKLIGPEKYLKALFEASVRIVNPEVKLKDKKRVFVQIHNQSQIDFELISRTEPAEVSLPKDITLAAGQTVVLRIDKKSTPQNGKQEIGLPFTVTNLLIGEQTGLPVDLKVRIEF